jgi:hypothetical protein
MNISKLVTLLSARLIFLQNQLIAAESVGDIESILSIESEIIDTQLTISQLNAI